MAAGAVALPGLAGPCLLVKLPGLWKIRLFSYKSHC